MSSQQERNSLPPSNRPDEAGATPTDVSSLSVSESSSLAIGSEKQQLFRPSLFDTGSTPKKTMHHFSRDEEGLPPKRPRRLWSVSDTQLPHLPLMYPPLNPQTSRVVRNAPFSIVAIRISECLRLRSVATKYDEESASADCMTIDQCHFQIQLWKGPSGSCIVDCLHLHGPLMTFHRNVYALLQAADCLSSGAKLPRNFESSALEFPHFLTPSNQTDKRLISVKESSQHHYSKAINGLEQVLSMLHKDRIEAQHRGMEYLVSLTDMEITAPDTAMYCALTVLGAPVSVAGHQLGVSMRELHSEWIMKLLVDRVMPGEPKSTIIEDREEFSFLRSCTSPDSFKKKVKSKKEDKKKTQAGKDTVNDPEHRRDSEIYGDEHHGGSMRSMALRAFVNALIFLEANKLLHKALAGNAPHLISPELLNALMEDIQGSMRHPSIVVGTRLASQNDAVLAIRCLRILAAHSDTAKATIATEQTMELLDKARTVGESSHVVLAEEANKAYLGLTEDFRSC